MQMLAGHPAQLEKVFNNQITNRYGVYTLNMYIQGEITEVIVDDWIPVVKDANTNALVPAFTSFVGKNTTDNSNLCVIWALLAEKAFCKVMGGYVPGQMSLGNLMLEYVLGFPAKDYNTNDPAFIDNLEEMGGLLLDFNNNTDMLTGQIMTEKMPILVDSSFY